MKNMIAKINIDVTGVSGARMVLSEIGYNENSERFVVAGTVNEKSFVAEYDEKMYTLTTLKNTFFDFKGKRISVAKPAPELSWQLKIEIRKIKATPDFKEKYTKKEIYIKKYKKRDSIYNNDEYTSCFCYQAKK